LSGNDGSKEQQHEQIGTREHCGWPDDRRRARNRADAEEGTRRRWITSTPKGQWEAARSTGLTFTETLGYVVLPQAIRLGVPPLTNRTIAITKNTALGTVIGVNEVLNQATTAQSFTGNATPLMMGAIAYIVLFIPVVAVGRWIETRFAWRRA
jgi:polar amino acid transport system permease protein